MPADLIYDETAVLIWYGKSKLAGIAGSFQPVAPGNLSRLGTEEIALA